MLEFGVYGFIAYSSMLMLIISTIKTIPIGGSLTIVRATYLIPGIICCLILASSGLTFTVSIINTNSTTIAANSSELFHENATQTTTTKIMNYPSWAILHFILAVVMIIYVIQQVLILLGLGGSEKVKPD